MINLHGELTSGDPCLVLMLDNWQYRYLETLTDCFAARGFQRTQSSSYFSLAPTETEVAKRAFMAAAPEQGNTKGGRDDLVVKSWGKHLGRRVRYLGGLGPWMHLQSLDADVYVLNYVEIDEALHRDEGQTGQRHAEQVRHLLEQIADGVDEVSQRLGIKSRLRIYATADHGSTRIREDVINVIDKRHYRKESVDQHHRFVTLSDRRPAPGSPNSSAVTSRRRVKRMKSSTVCSRWNQLSYWTTTQSR